MNIEQYIYFGLCFLYILSLSFILIYSIGAFTLTIYFLRAQKKKIKLPIELDFKIKNNLVLIQLPIYNEKYVIERLIDSVCQIEYPLDLLQIDILDDSDDETSELIASKVEEYKKKGFSIEHKKRNSRKGYKAGALEHFIDDSDCEYIVIFDADFVPPKNFLLELLPHFKNKNIGMVQSRWGHLNQNQSSLTKLQAFGLNFHFTIEHEGRNEGNYLMNFNGTAGIWRKKCIKDAGGWSETTLTEDLDLSYRAQLKGWKFKYVSEIISDAELPMTVQALKVQQYRWNKGGAQCLKKLIKPIIISKEINFRQKLFAIIHLLGSTTYVFVFNVFILCLLLLLLRSKSELVDWTLKLGSVFFVSTILLCYSYWISWKSNQSTSKISFLVNFFIYLAFTSGLSFYNLTAVISGFISKSSEFKRTPKFNTRKKNKLKLNCYSTPKISYHLIIEIVLSFLFFLAMINSLYYLDFITFLFFSLITYGFGMVSYFQIKEVFLKN